MLQVRLMPIGHTPTKWIGGYREGGKLGDLYSYKQDHIFRDWDDIRQHANKRIDNVAKLYGPGLADEVKSADRCAL